MNSAFGIVSLIVGVAVAVSTAQTFQTLHVFNGQDGADPQAALAQGPNGAFYGAACGGGHNGDGTIFSRKHILGFASWDKPTLYCNDCPCSTTSL